MTLKQLEYFLEIAKMGSVTKAAKNLNLSQPPLSLSLKMLEEELGVSLFTRDKKVLDITPEGLILKERARAILGLIDEAVVDVQSSYTNKNLVLRIGTIGSVNNRFLPKIIAKLSQQYSYVKFSVFEGGTDNILTELSQGNLDLCFVRQPFNVSAFRYIPVRDPGLKEGESDYFVTIALPQFYDYFFEGGALASIDLNELRGKPLVVHRRYHEMLHSACHKKGFTPHVICENGEIQSSLSWAKEGIGIAIAPYTSALLNTEPSLIIRRLESFSVSPQVCLVWNPAEKLSNEAKAFISLVQRFKTGLPS